MEGRGGSGRVEIKGGKGFGRDGVGGIEGEGKGTLRGRRKGLGERE